MRGEQALSVTAEMLIGRQAGSLDEMWTGSTGDIQEGTHDSV